MSAPALRRLLALALALALACGCTKERRPSTTEPASHASSESPEPAAWAVTPDPTSAEFEDEIQAYEAADRRNPPKTGETLFVGSSSIRLWQTLAQDFAPHGVKNRGFGGATIRNVIDFGRRIVLPYAPPRIVFFAGSNDIHAGASAAAVTNDFKRFVAGVWEVQPKTRIAFVSITTSPSRFAEIERVREANRLIQEYVRSEPRLRFIDVLSVMVDPSGKPRPELYIGDRLHPSRAAYALWIPRIEPFLREP